MTTHDNDLAELRRVGFSNLPEATRNRLLNNKPEMQITHYTFFQPDGTCFSIAAADAWEAKQIELTYLGIPLTGGHGNASFCQLSKDVQTPAGIRAALRKAHRMHGKWS